MGRPSKKKDNKNTASKTRASPRKEQSAMPRAGEEEEASASQMEEAPVDAGVSGDDDGSAPQLSNPFTPQQDEQIAAFFGKYPLFYDMAHPDYKNKKKRELLIVQFAQSLFPSGKWFFVIQIYFS